MGGLGPPPHPPPPRLVTLAEKPVCRLGKRSPPPPAAAMDTFRGFWTDYGDFRPTSGSLPGHFRLQYVPLGSPHSDESNGGRTSPNGPPGTELFTISGMLPAISGIQLGVGELRGTFLEVSGRTTPREPLSGRLAASYQNPRLSTHTQTNKRKTFIWGGYHRSAALRAALQKLNSLSKECMCSPWMEVGSERVLLTEDMVAVECRPGPWRGNGTAVRPAAILHLVGLPVWHRLRRG